MGLKGAYRADLMMIESGNEITIKQGQGRLKIDIDTGDIFIYDDINNESVFIDPSVWGEVKSAVDGLLKRAAADKQETKLMDWVDLGAGR